MDFIIKKIDYLKTLPIRNKVMWPNKPLEYVQLPNDKEGRHFGLFVNKKLISVISIFEKMNDIQFRKFATLNEYQGHGYGTKLLKATIDLIEKDGFNKTWCNARVNKISFYRKFGLVETKRHFDKGGIKYVIMEKITNNV